MALGSAGTGANTGAIAVVTGAGNWAGAGGGGTGAISEFMLPVCAHSDPGSPGHPSPSAKTAASAAIAIPFNARSAIPVIVTDSFIR